MMDSIRDADSGLTLVELLVAMSMLSLLVILLYAPFRLLDRGWDASLGPMESLTQVRTMQQFMDHYLETSRPVEIDTRDGTRSLFSGTSDTLAFVSSMPAYLGVGGLYRMTLTVTEKPGGGHGLHLRRALLHPDLIEDPEARELNSETDLVRDVREIRFRYFGSEEVDSEPQWREGWEDLPLPPTLVEVSITDKRGRLRRLVTPLRVREPLRIKDVDVADDG